MNRPQIDLSKLQQRDNALETLESWHPTFHEVKPQLTTVLGLLEASIEEYAELLLKECPDEPDELFAHLSKEVEPWLYNRISQIMRWAFEKTRELLEE